MTKTKNHKRITELAEKENLVVIPRDEYEALLELKKIKEFTPTPTHKKALARARKNAKEGKTLTYDELVKKLEN